MQNSALIKKLEEIIRNQAKENNIEFLKMVDDTIKWNDIFYVTLNQSDELSGDVYENTNILCLIKCIIIGKVFNISDSHLPFEIADRKSYQSFIGINSLSEIPESEIVTEFRNILLKSGAYDEIFDMFYEQLLESKFHIMDNLSDNDEKKVFQSKLQKNNFAKNENFDNKINEIENRIKMLYERKLPLTLRGIDDKKSNELQEKLMNVKDQVDKLANEKNKDDLKENGNYFSEDGAIISNKTEPSPEYYERLLNIEKRINNMSEISTHDDAEISEKEVKASDMKPKVNEEELYKNLFDSFYKSLEDRGIVLKPVSKADETSTETFVSEEEKIPEFHSAEIDKKIAELDALYEARKLEEEKEFLNSIETVPEPVIEKEKPSFKPEEKIPIKESDRKPAFKIHDPFVITPKAKREGIFNDANLTEDYELGYRFYKLGFKTGFFNLKLDNDDEATRIATAEFFPNSFWPAVKQRSRWIAGICFQNWKSHKWHGSLATKYFLFRDRKSLFSFFGAFLSNIVFLYLVYSLICNIFHIKYVFSLVGQSSVLWYLMIANLIFMISRASHRFIFTYNWYGFKYAFFSFFRLILDTFVNFFAIMRSFSVYKKTKKKVVWDSTSHY
jgi:hypothetical protein